MRNRQSVIDHLVDHYENPRNNGELHNPDVTMRGGNPGCGDVIDLYVKIDEASGSLEAISFTGEGCTISQASASVLMGMVGGKALEEIDSVTYDDLVDTLGRDVVMSRPKCATLSLTTLKAALRKYRHEKRARDAGYPVETEIGFVEV
ncbi:MAG: iron-sulfur cluster assembly scaffold protein [Anaerolineae bacterium]